MKKESSKFGKTSITIGPTFLELLTAVFIVLKLTHKIEWSWVWVLAPTWIPIALFVLVLAICVVIPIIAKIVKSRNKKDR